SVAVGLLLASGCADVDAVGDEATVGAVDDAERALVAQMPAVVVCSADDATFYDAPDLTGKVDGALLKCRSLPGLSDLPGYARYRVMYKSSVVVHRGAGGATTETRPYAATGEVYVPTGETVTPSDRPVIASLHGLTGMRVDCAPSKRAPFGDRRLIDALGQGLAAAQPSQGKPVLVVPDLLGQGTASGLWSSDRSYSLLDPLTFNTARRSPFSNIAHSYVSIESQGRATVDAVRAARSIGASGLSASPRWFAVGESQGGHGALSVGEVVQRGYGAELRLRGVIAGAPGSALDDPNSALNPVKSFLVPNVIAGLSLEWPDIRPSQLLSNNALLAYALTANTQCLSSTDQVGSWLVTFGAYVGSGSITRTNIEATLQNPTLAPALLANSPGHARSLVPVFVAQVEGDPFILRQRTDNLVALERTTNPGLVTYCVYNSPTTLSSPPLDPTKWSGWFNGVAGNHHPLARTLDKTPAQVLADPLPLIRQCSAPNGQPIAATTANAASWHPVEWAKARYLAP
ncbi:MAG TPA: lipase family protein, partial [Polyangiales bacterium]